MENTMESKKTKDSQLAFTFSIPTLRSVQDNIFVKEDKFRSQIRRTLIYMEIQQLRQGKLKSMWLKNKEHIIPNGVLLGTVMFILILTVMGGLGQKIVTEQKIQTLLKQGVLKT